MRAHRRMPRGMGEWLAEGEGPIPVGCCVITAGVMIRGVRHGCERIFDATDAKFRDESLHQGRIRECSRIFKHALCAAALSFNTKTSWQGSNFCIHIANLGDDSTFLLMDERALEL